jgi:hypothetical protein
MSLLGFIENRLNPHHIDEVLIMESFLNPIQLHLKKRAGKITSNTVYGCWGRGKFSGHHRHSFIVRNEC